MAKTYLFAVILFASACNFLVDGVTTGTVTGSEDLGSPPVDAAMSTADLATSPTVDLATPSTADLAMPPKGDLAMPPPPTNVGDACSGPCGPGLMCMNWVPAGYCSKMCKKANDCPTGSTCVDVGLPMNYCLLDANADGSCARSDVSCRNCQAQVCGPSTFCDAC